jgi:hypothetical protein
MMRRLTRTRLQILRDAAESRTGRISPRTSASDQKALEELDLAASLCEHRHSLDDPDPDALDRHRGCPHFLSITGSGRQFVIEAADVVVTSFGYLHGGPPPAHLTLDVRTHFRDPHIDPALRHMTAFDEPVRDAVMRTDGILPLVEAAGQTVAAYRAGPVKAQVAVAVGCAGGRHRAASVAMALAAYLRQDELHVALVHRDITRPVVDR